MPPAEVMRIAFVCNEGITKPDMTPEDVAENLATLQDLSTAEEVIVQTLAGEAVEAAREEAGIG